MKNNNLLDFKLVSNKIKLFALFTSLLTFICTLSTPLFLKKLIDSFTEEINLNLLIITLSLFILQIISIAFSSYFLSILGETLTYHLRLKIWNKILNLKYSYFTKNIPGTIVSKLLSNTSAAVNLIALELPKVVIGVLTLLGSLIILIYLDLLIGIFASLIFPLILIILIPCGKKIQELTYQYYEVLSDMSGFFFSKISNIKMIKSFNMQDQEYKNGQDQIEKIFISEKKRALTNAWVNSIINMVTTFSIYLIIGIGFYRFVNQALTVGDLLACIFYLFTITTPISSISTFLISYANYKGIIPSLKEILEYSEETSTEGFATNIIGPLESSAISFKSVTFSYNKNTVLKDITFSIPKSSVVAIIGESGSGKTTVFNLLEKFYDNFDGEIFVNNRLLKLTDTKDIRSLISYVSQEDELINGTVLDNLLYGVNKEVTMKEIIEYCKKTNTLDFILKLPDAFDTIVGGNDTDLSMGQKQRLAITRALIKESPILLLDEATSNLDSISEGYIKKIINENTQKRTILVITHNMTLIENVDQIIVLENGEVTGIGTHYELSKSNKKYMELLKNHELSIY